MRLLARLRVTGQAKWANLNVSKAFLCEVRGWAGFCRGYGHRVENVHAFEFATDLIIVENTVRKSVTENPYLRCYLLGE